MFFRKSYPAENCLEVIYIAHLDGSQLLLNEHSILHESDVISLATVLQAPMYILRQTPPLLPPLTWLS